MIFHAFICRDDFMFLDFTQFYRSTSAKIESLLIGNQTSENLFLSNHKLNEAITTLLVQDVYLSV